MRLRFAIDEGAYADLREKLDAASGEQPVGKRLSDVYLDTPDDALAERGVALRFRRVTSISKAAGASLWRKQWIWPKHECAPNSLKALGIRRLKQRVDATFTVRIERWTWKPRSQLLASLDCLRIDAGAGSETYREMRLTFRRRNRDLAERFAAEMSLTTLASCRPRERGRKLLRLEPAAGGPTR